MMWLMFILVINGYKFNLIATLPEGSGPATGATVFISDMNHNGWDELFLPSAPLITHHKWIVYEYRPTNQFIKIYGPEGKQDNDTSLSVMDWGDSDKDGLSEFLIGVSVRTSRDPYNYICYPAILESKSPDTFPSVMRWCDTSFIHDSIDVTPEKFVDLDGDGKIEILTSAYWHMTDRRRNFRIYENRGDNKFTLTFTIPSFPYANIMLYRSFVFGDFDNDGKKEWFFAVNSNSVRRSDAWIWECKGDDSHHKVWEDTVFWINMYDAWLGNDTDGDGKPEIFVATGWIPWPTGTVLSMYEATGDNTYKFVNIDTIWGNQLAGASTSSCGDIDRDGREEIIVCVGTKIIVYKATGNDKYERVWEWKNNLTPHYCNTQILCHDFNKNGYDEIIITNNDSTYIFEIDTTYGIASKPKTPKSFNLSISPNPAKGRIDIRYEIPVREAINLSIYDASGRLVKTLARTQNQKPGTYKLKWNGRDDNGKILPPGVYFIKFEAKGINQIKKVILMR